MTDEEKDKCFDMCLKIIKTLDEQPGVTYVIGIQFTPDQPAQILFNGNCEAVECIANKMPELHADLPQEMELDPDFEAELNDDDEWEDKQDRE